MPLLQTEWLLMSPSRNISQVSWKYRRQNHCHAFSQKVHTYHLHKGQARQRESVFQTAKRPELIWHRFLLNRMPGGLPLIQLPSLEYLLNWLFKLYTSIREYQFSRFLIVNNFFFSCIKLTMPCAATFLSFVVPFLSCLNVWNVRYLYEKVKSHIKRN